MSDLLDSILIRNYSLNLIIVYGIIKNSQFLPFYGKVVYAMALYYQSWNEKIFTSLRTSHVHKFYKLTIVSYAYIGTFCAFSISHKLLIK